MSKGTRICMIMALSFIVVGGMIFMGVMQKLKWDFTKLSTVKYETNEYEIQEEYDNISILTNTGDVEVMMSQDNNTKVICREQVKVKHAVTVNKNTLEIKVEDSRKWYEHIEIAFGNSKITVYLPQEQYEKLSVKSNTGDTFVEQVSAKIIHIEGTTGNVSLKNVIAKEKISIKIGTGDVIFDASDAQDISVKTSTGNVKGTLLSDKIYLVETNTGKIDVPKTTTGGVCEITTSTGDIKIRVK